MESYSALYFSFLLLLFSNSINARKDVGEYWRGVMKDQPMPEAIRGLARDQPALSNSHDRTKCHSTDTTETSQSWPRPNLSVYDNDAGLKAEKKFYADDIEPRLSATAYSEYHDNDAGLKAEKKFYADDIEPRPSATAYSEYHDNDAGLKAEKKFSADNIEPRPSITAYSE
ncbi:hypothetical protein K2173_013583 [Erythroxylum novogranatense]|uniref:Organ specific protein n=1 Tax=Erythroxylum novogranatense TaxID=1862640 RepID=A0AAV8TJW7_9ROSI|nr:hypothetical protein K2173_013583 [Erythroxylum novogranatense]